MNDTVPGCLLCRGVDADPELQRVQVWEDRHWRVTTSLYSEVPGFSYLEPKRHIPYITDLNGEEARTFGDVLAQTSGALRDVADAEVVYVYIFGDHAPHLHVHLAPHRQGGPLNSQMIRGEIVARPLPGGHTAFESKDFPPLPVEQLREVAERIRELMGS
jgi:diadenosine tetraphosphate (Ap4A) HIT family hydrolase